jgi:hypothetical protein
VDLLGFPNGRVRYLAILLIRFKRM